MAMTPVLAAVICLAHEPLGAFKNYMDMLIARIFHFRVIKTSSSSDLSHSNTRYNATLEKLGADIEM